MTLAPTRICPAVLVVVKAVLAAAQTSAPASPGAAQTRRAHLLPGFAMSRHFGEQTKRYRFEPGVQILLNAPGPERFNPAHPTRLIFYALPNGNTTEETQGRADADGPNWRYGIQHIGAQTRRLREVSADVNIVVAYLEADGKSWPAWKQQHPDRVRQIPAILDSARPCLPSGDVTCELAAHSGGGSLIFGYLDALTDIPPSITRIAFLDANYGYSDASRHGDKLIAWLRGDTRRRLCVVAYDDRNVMLDGKPVVSATGGTYRRTFQMADRISRDIPLSRQDDTAWLRWRGLEGRIDLIVLKNPANAILHTVLVERNGFLHAMTSGTDLEGKAGRFNGRAAYRQWIQPN